METYFVCHWPMIAINQKDCGTILYLFYNVHMKTFKKLFSVSAIVALLGTLAPMYAFGADYSAELVQAYDYAHGHGITTMSSIDNADMYGNLTRIAMAKMLANYAIDVLGLTPDTTKNCTFPDVSAALDEQYDNGVTKACQLWLMGVGIEKFNPNGLVTRAEFGTAFSRALNGGDAEKLAEMNKADPYYKEHLNFLKEEGIMTKIDTPTQLEVRGYVMLMMMRSDSSYTPTEGCTAEELLKCLTADDYDACIATCSNENTDEEESLGNGLAKVSKVSVPAAQDVPANAVNVKVGTIKLTAGEYDTKVSSVEISRDGLATFTKANLEVALRWANVETAYAGVSPTSNTAKVKFSPALTIKAGKSETFDVVVQMPLNAAANNTHNFSVTNVVVSNGTAEGYPVKLGTIKTTSATSKTVTVTVADWDSSIKAWESQKLLWTITVDFDTVAGTLNRMTLVNNATANKTDKIGEAFDNIQAYVDDKVVGNVSWTDDKIILSDLNLSKDSDERVVIELKADVVYWKDTANYSFVVDSVDASEKNAAYGMSISAGSTLPQTVDSITVKWNDITFKKVSLENKDIIPGAKNILAFDATFKAASDTTIKSVDITPTLSTVANFETLYKLGSAKLIINWDDYDLDDADFTGWVKFTVPVNVDIDANVPAKVQIKFSTNIPSAVLPEVQAAFKVDITSAVSTENSTIAYATTLAPYSSNGDTLSIEEWSITLDTATIAGPVTRSIFSSKNQEVWRFSVKAENDDVTLNALDLQLTNAGLLTDNAAEALFASNLTLRYVDNDSEEEVRATFTFDNSNNTIVHITNIDYKVTKDNVANFKVMANLWKLDTATIWWTTFFTVVNNKVKAKSSTRSNLTNSTTPALSSTPYTLRVTAPTIAVSKYSDNQFKVVIKNVDADNEIDIQDLKYTIKTNDWDYQATAAKVCLTEDVNQSTCTTSDGTIGTLVNAKLIANPAIATLTKGQEKTYYILLDGSLIEPELLKATISSLSYNKKGAATLSPENYNETAK